MSDTMPKTPSKYDSVIIANYDHYKEDCGLKIGDHKILCKVFDAQDDNLQTMLSAGYEVQAKLITGIVREMLNEQKIEIAAMLTAHKKEIFEEIGKIKKAVEDLSAEVKSQKKEIKDVDCKVEGVKNDVLELRGKVESIARELNHVKKKNTWAVILIRGLGWSTLGYVIIRLIHGPFIN